jgi:hypothetical protein
VEEETEAALQEPSGMTLFPNPAVGGTVNLRSDRFNGDFTLQVFDMTGRIAFEKEVRQYAGTTLTLDIAGLENGTYIVRMVNAVTQEAKPLVVRR